MIFAFPEMYINDLLAMISIDSGNFHSKSHLKCFILYIENQPAFLLESVPVALIDVAQYHS